MAATDLLTLDEAKAALNIETVDVAYDVDLARVISAASALVEQWMGPVVVNGTYTEVLSGGANGYIQPTRTPVYSVQSVTEYQNTVSTSLVVESVSVQPAEAFVFRNTSPHDGLITRRQSGSDATFPSGTGNVQVTYTPGRVTTTALVPPLFKEAAVRALVVLWDARGAGSGAAAAGGDGRSYGGVAATVDKVREGLLRMMPDEFKPVGVA